MINVSTHGMNIHARTRIFHNCIICELENEISQEQQIQHFMCVRDSTYKEVSIYKCIRNENLTTCVFIEAWTRKGELIIGRCDKKSRRLTVIRSQRKFPNTGPNTISCKSHPPPLLANFPAVSPVEFHYYLRVHSVWRYFHFEALVDGPIRANNLALQNENSIKWRILSVYHFDRST